MKWPLFTALLLAAVVAAFWAGSRHGRGQAVSKGSADGRQVMYYVDPMNPAHTSDKPGKAPCGMDMEPVYADASGGTASGPVISGTVKLSLEKQQLIGVRVGLAERKPLQHTLRLLGRVAPDETRVHRINAAVDGWILTCSPHTSGSFVKKDDTLASFYSPEFLGATRALIFALSSRDRVQATAREPAGPSNQPAPFEANLQQYADSLRNLGMSEKQIAEIARLRVFNKSVDIVAPADGFITERNVSDGQRFDKGSELYRLADLTKIWILADVFEKEARLLPPQLQARISVPEQNRTFTATLSKTLPQFDGVSRTLKLRFESENPDTLLKPGMFVDVELPISLPEALVVPVEAVLGAGLRQTVFVDRGNGYFEPRGVQTGVQIGGNVQILSGLEVGERIVISGNFLLDSESQMKIAAAHLQEKSKPVDPVCKMSVDEAKAKAAGRISEHAGKTYYFCNDGCKKQFDKNPAEFLGERKPQTPMGPVAQAGSGIDPVCGMKVTEEKARAANRVVNFGGKTYYFCNDGCKEEFVASPQKFLASTETKAMEMTSGAKSAETNSAHPQ